VHRIKEFNGIEKDDMGKRWALMVS
jgi:hypothetical protein